jgi:hypothetical protein
MNINDLPPGEPIKQPEVHVKRKASPLQQRDVKRASTNIGGRANAVKVPTQSSGTERTQFMEKMQKSESVLKERFRTPGKFPKPSTEEQVTAAKDEDVVILHRGMGGKLLAHLAKDPKTFTLSNEAPNPNIGKPTDEEARAQVGEQASLPELTSNPKIAEAFGRDNFVVAIAIKKKYLRKGSGSEGGWIFKREAPIVDFLWKEGPSAQFKKFEPKDQEKQIANTFIKNIARQQGA